MMKRALALGVAVVSMTPCVASSEDWPQWRGADRDAVVKHSPPLAESWPDTGPRKVWESEPILGHKDNGGMSQVVVAGGRVFVYCHWKAKDGDAGPGKAVDTFYCLNAADGKTVWKKESREQKAYGNGASGTPCVSGGRLYALTGTRAFPVSREPGVCCCHG